MKTKIIRIRTPSFNNLNLKKNKIEQDIKNISGKQVKVKMIDLVDLISKKSVYISDEEMQNLYKRRRKNFKGGFLI